MDEVTKSDDYKNGWYDGYQAAMKDTKKNPVPSNIPDNNMSTYSYPSGYVTKVWQNSCSVCGISWASTNGSVKSYGYVCSNSKCPSRISF